MTVVLTHLFKLLSFSINHTQQFILVHFLNNFPFGSMWQTKRSTHRFRLHRITLYLTTLANHSSYTVSKTQRATMSNSRSPSTRLRDRRTIGICAMYNVPWSSTRLTRPRSRTCCSMNRDGIVST